MTARHEYDTPCHTHDTPLGLYGMTLPSGDEVPCSGPLQWARGDVGLKPSAAARPG